MIPTPAPQACADCKHATAAGHMGAAIGYFSCALQAAWLLRVVCNINQWVRRNPIAPDGGAAN